MNEECSFLETADGSVTLADMQTGEWYHNSAGAFSEAMENYVLPSVFLIRPSLRTKKSVKLLDACFGLGYNSFAFLNHLLESKVELDIIEIFAVELDSQLTSLIARVLDQKCFEVLKVSGFKDVNSGLSFNELFEKGPSSETNSIEAALVSCDAGIKMIKLNLVFADIRSFIPNFTDEHHKSFDLVFHDPFSPAKFPQFWTIDFFNCYRKLLVEDKGMLFTYSIASAVRGALVQSGFSIYKTKAVGKKQGGTLALANMPVGSNDSLETIIARDLSGLQSFGDLKQIENSELFFTLPGEEVCKVLSASGIPYRDARMKLDRKAILKNRESEQTVFKQSSSN